MWLVETLWRRRQNIILQILSAWLFGQVEAFISKKDIEAYSAMLLQENVAKVMQIGSFQSFKSFQKQAPSLFIYEYLWASTRANRRFLPLKIKWMTSVWASLLGIVSVRAMPLNFSTSISPCAWLLLHFIQRYPHFLVSFQIYSPPNFPVIVWRLPPTSNPWFDRFFEQCLLTDHPSSHQRHADHFRRVFCHQALLGWQQRPYLMQRKNWRDERRRRIWLQELMGEGTASDLQAQNRNGDIFEVEKALDHLNLSFPHSLQAFLLHGVLHQHLLFVSLRACSECVSHVHARFLAGYRGLLHVQLHHGQTPLFAFPLQ